MYSCCFPCFYHLHSFFPLYLFCLHFFPLAFTLCFLFSVASTFSPHSYVRTASITGLNEITADYLLDECDRWMLGLVCVLNGIAGLTESTLLKTFPPPSHRAKRDLFYPPLKWTGGDQVRLDTLKCPRVGSDLD